MHARHFLFVAVASLLLSGAAGAAHFPSRPIRIVVGFTPGGQPDIFSRLIAAKVSDALGQPVIVENRPGAGGTIATKIAADATPDGYTMLAVSASFVIAPAVRKLNYDPIRDFAGITEMYRGCYLLVVPPSLGVKNVKALIAMAKAKPGAFNFASAGVGSGTYFAGVVFKDAAKIDAVNVPYRGIPEALNDTITGRVQFFMAPLASSAPLVRSGKLVALGVSALKRVSIYPDVPTLAEAGLPGFSFDSWGGLLVPAKTPPAIIKLFNRVVTGALRSPDIESRMHALGVEPAPTTPQAFDKMIATQIRAMAVVARRAGLKPR